MNKSGDTQYNGDTGVYGLSFIWGLKLVFRLYVWKDKHAIILGKGKLGTNELIQLTSHHDIKACPNFV